jgi:hypothetical protein
MSTERALTKLAFIGGKMAVINGKSYFSWVQRRQCIPGSAISNWPLAVSQNQNQPQHRNQSNPDLIRAFSRSFAAQSRLGVRYE